MPGNCGSRVQILRVVFAALMVAPAAARAVCGDQLEGQPRRQVRLEFVGAEDDSSGGHVRFAFTVGIPVEAIDFVEADPFDRKLVIPPSAIEEILDRLGIFEASANANAAFGTGGSALEAAVAVSRRGDIFEVEGYATPAARSLEALIGFYLELHAPAAAHTTGGLIERADFRAGLPAGKTPEQIFTGTSTLGDIPIHGTLRD
jgi:hypothetical protein